ncbi:MAG: histidine phosphatase family protein [Oligoflexus sp.]
MQELTTEIFLIRHGQTVSNTLGRIQGHSDSPLSELGQKQADYLAKRLSSVPFSRIYSSDLGRAMATAQILAQAQLVQEVYPDRRLREVSFGQVEGLTWAEVATEHPDLQTSWFQHEAEAKLPGGESREDVTNRVFQFLDDVVLQHKGQSILAVTHGGVLACILAKILQIGKGIRPASSFDNASLNIVSFKNDRWKIKTWNDSWHFREIEEAVY